MTQYLHSLCVSILTSLTHTLYIYYKDNVYAPEHFLGCHKRERKQIKRERERGRQRERDRQKEKERETERPTDRA